MQKSLLCPICDSHLLVDFTKKKEKNILICSDCRHLFWEGMPTEKEILIYYQQNYTESHQQLDIQESNREYYTTHVREIENELGKNAKNIKLLDYGSSYPVFLEEFLKAGGNGIASDSGNSILEWAKNKEIPMLTPTEIFSKIADETFDLMRFSHVLEHLIDPRRELKVLINKLKPGGIIYITQPNFPCFKLQSTDYDLKDSVWPSHLHFFSPISSKTMLTKLGCKIYRFNTVPLPCKIELKKLKTLVDTSVSKKTMGDLAYLKPYSQTMTSYPWYLGENSIIWAEKSFNKFKSRQNIPYRVRLKIRKLKFKLNLS